MLRIAFVYGAIAGVLVIAIITAGLVIGGPGSGSSSQVFGYLIMLIALTLIFFGVKQHRDANLGGVIGFAAALIAGLAIAAVAGVFYVAGWELYLASTDYEFIDQYADGYIEAKQAAGATAEEVAKLSADMDALATNYANPLFRLPITFMEIFPVGVIIALVSAAILRNPRAFPAKARG